MLNSCPSDSCDGPGLMRAFEIASLDSFSCNYKANRSVTLSRRREACISHVCRFEIGAFSLRLWLFVDGISKEVLVSGWHVNGVYMGLTNKRGRSSQGVAT